MAQAASKPMIDQGEGVIVLTASATFNIGGVGGSMGQAGPAYASSKGAIVARTRSLARALGPHTARTHGQACGDIRCGAVPDYIWRAFHDRRNHKRQWWHSYGVSIQRYFGALTYERSCGLRAA